MDKRDNITLGAIIRQARIRKKFNKQESLADSVGIPPEQLSRIETDKIVPNDFILSKLAKELGLNLKILLVKAKIEQLEKRGNRNNFADEQSISDIKDKIILRHRQP